MAEVIKELLKFVLKISHNHGQNLLRQNVKNEREGFFHWKIDFRFCLNSFVQGCRINTKNKDNVFSIL